MAEAVKRFRVQVVAHHSESRSVWYLVRTDVEEGENPHVIGTMHTRKDANLAALLLNTYAVLHSPEEEK